MSNNAIYFLLFFLVIALSAASSSAAALVDNLNYVEQYNVWATYGDYCRNTLIPNSMFAPLDTCDDTGSITTSTGLETSNNVYEVSYVNGDVNSDGCFHLFFAKTNKSYTSITQVWFRYEGKSGDLDRVDPSLYVWNYTSGLWVMYANEPLTLSDTTVTFNSTIEIAAVGDVINSSGHVAFGVIDLKAASGMELLYTDYAAFKFVYVDNVDPTFSALKNDTSVKKYQNMSVNVTVTDAMSTVSSVYLYWNETGTMSLTQTITGLSSSSYNAKFSRNVSNTEHNKVVSWKVGACDSASNCANSSTYSFVVGNTAPVYSQEVADQTKAHNVNLDIKVNCTDIDGEALTYGDNTTLFVINSTTGAVYDNPSQSDAGVRAIKITCTDGTEAVEQTFVYTVTNAAPTFLHALSNKSMSHSVNLVYDFNCTDAEGDTITYADNTTLFAINSTTGIISDNPTQDEIGVRSVKITCSDGARNVNGTFLYTVTNAAPTFAQSLVAKSVHHNVNLYYDVNCSDADGDTMTYYDNSTLFNVVSGTGIINDNPSQNEEGVRIVNVSCDDGALNVSQVFVYTIINDAPLLTSASITPASPTNLNDLTCNNGTTSDAEGDAVSLTYQWHNGTAWLNYNSKVLLAGNTSTGQLWKCKITPSDGFESGISQESQTVGIDSSRVSPTITSAYFRTNGTFVSNSTQPTNRFEELNFTLTFNDSNVGDRWTVYVCNTSNITSSGCGSGTWCESSANVTSKSFNCSLSILRTLDYRSYSFSAYVVDNSSMASSSSVGTFVVGDDIPPVITSVTVDSTAKTEGQISYAYINCEDESYGSGVATVKTHLYTWFDSGSTYSGNLTGVFTAGTQYMAQKSMNAVGVWGYRSAYCYDEQGNGAGTYSVNLNVTVSSTPVVVNNNGGGGGPSLTITPTTAAETCDIDVEPTTLTFKGSVVVLKLTLKNRENFSLTPTYEIDNTLYDVRAESATLYSGSELIVSVVDMRSTNASTTSIMNISFSDVCSPLSVVVSTDRSESKELGILGKLLSTLLTKIDLLGLNVGYYVVFIVIFLFVAVVLLVSNASASKKFFIGTFLFVMFNVIALYYIPVQEQQSVDDTFFQIESFKNTDALSQPVVSLELANKDINVYVWWIAILAVITTCSVCMYVLLR